jgi:hypothetical protein
VLTALPGTQLERRLAREGRLLERSNGETFGRPNFKTKRPESVLLGTYRDALAAIYQPERYFERCLRALQLRPDSTARSSQPWSYGLRCLARSLWRQGLTGKYRRAYWRFMGKVLRHTPQRFARALSLAIAGEHMIRYTHEVVLPRLAEAITETRVQEIASATKPAQGEARPCHRRVARMPRAVSSAADDFAPQTAQSQP